MPDLTDPVLRRTFECAIDYDNKEDLLNRIDEMREGIEKDDPMATVDHPDWLWTRWNCCGGSGP